MCKVSEHINDAGTKKAIVYRDASNDEYQVMFFRIIPGIGMWARQPGAEYFTDDKADAIATAIYEVSKV